MEKQRELRENRIRQVRKQSKEVASEIRLRVQKKKGQCLDSLRNDVKQGWHEDKENELLNLERLYQKSLHNVGNGWKEAKCQHDRDQDYEQKVKINVLAATKRNAKALAALREKKAKERENIERNICARKFALDIEKERAALVASLPLPIEDPVDQVLDKGDVHGVILHDQIQNPTFTYLWAAGLTKKAEFHEGEDARTDAIIEMAKCEEFADKKAKLEKDRVAKRKDRFKIAWKKECLQKDYACTLEELKNVKRQENLQNKWNSNNVMQLLCPPVKKKMVENKHLHSEEAVESTLKSIRENYGDFKNEQQLKFTSKGLSSGDEMSLENSTLEKAQKLIAFSLKEETPQLTSGKRTLESLGKQSEALLKNTWKNKGEISPRRGILCKLLEQIQQLRSSLTVQNNLRLNQEMPFGTRQRNLSAMLHSPCKLKAPVMYSEKHTGFLESCNEYYYPEFRSTMEESGKAERRNAESRTPSPRQNIIKALEAYNKELDKLIKNTQENSIKTSENIGSRVPSEASHLSVTPSCISEHFGQQAMVDNKQSMMSDNMRTYQEELLARAYLHHTPSDTKEQPNTSHKILPMQKDLSDQKDICTSSKEVFNSDSCDSLGHFSTPSGRHTLSDYVRYLAPKYFHLLEISKNIPNTLVESSVKENQVDIINILDSSEHPITAVNSSSQSSDEACVRNLESDHFKELQKQNDNYWKHTSNKEKFSPPHSDILSSTLLSKTVENQKRHDIIQKLRSVNESLSGLLEKKDICAEPCSSGPIHTNIFQDGDLEMSLQSLLPEKLDRVEEENLTANKPPVTVAKLPTGHSWAPHELSTIKELYNLISENSNTTEFAEHSQSSERELDILGDNVAPYISEYCASSSADLQNNSISHVLTPPEMMFKTTDETDMQSVKPAYQQNSSVTSFTVLSETTERESDVLDYDISSSRPSEFYPLSTADWQINSISHVVTPQEVTFRTLTNETSVQAGQNLVSTQVQNYVLPTINVIDCSSVESLHLLSVIFSSPDSMTNTSEPILSPLPSLLGKKSCQKNLPSPSVGKNTDINDATISTGSGSFHILTPITISRASSEDGIMEEPDLTLVGSELSFDYLETY